MLARPPIRRYALVIALAAALVAAQAPASAAPPAEHATGSTTDLAAAPADSTPTSDAAEIVVQYRGGVTTQDLSRALASGVSLAGARVSEHGQLVATVPDGSDADALAEELMRDPAVAAAAPAFDIRAQALPVAPPNDPFYSTARYSLPYPMLQRGYMGPTSAYPQSTGLEDVWEFASWLDASPAPVKVAVLDTGFSAPAVDYSNVFVPKWDYVDGDSNTADDSGHGTWVASVLGASANNGQGIAGSLQSSASQVLIYRVMNGSGWGTGADACEAIKAAADAGARVINCSFGEETTHPGVIALWEDAVSYAWDRGAVVVAASGNGGADMVGDPVVLYPAKTPRAIGVGSITYDAGVAAGRASGLRSSFSNYGHGLDVVTPGEGILSLAPGSTDVGPYLGTSFAAAVASGSIAYLFSVAPDATPAQVRDAIVDTARPYPPAAPDAYRYGNGRLDVWAALGRLGVPLPEGAPDCDRLCGATRYGTAAAISRAQFPGTVETLVLASGEDFPDALAAGVLAHEVGGPVLLTRAGSLPPETADEISRLSPSEIIVVGGPGAVASSVAATARSISGATVERVQGSDRYETALQIARELAERSGEPPAAAVVASGEGFPDALSAVPMAASAGRPILLARSTDVTWATRQGLDELGIEGVVIVGGPGVVGEAVASELAVGGRDVARVWGPDRYQTSREVAAYAVGNGILDFHSLGLATGRDFPDALAGGGYMAYRGSPLILADTVDASLSRWLEDRGAEVQGVAVFGGAAAVSEVLEAQVAMSLARGG
jgi:cell wall-associated protease